MSLVNQTICIEEICKAMGWRASYLKRNWLRLHQNDGFPRKLPDSWRWPRALVEMWISTGGASQCQTLPTGEAITMVSAQNTKLRNRYAAKPQLEAVT